MVKLVLNSTQSPGHGAWPNIKDLSGALGLVILILRRSKNLGMCLINLFKFISHSLYKCG
jgi:hypothetical protein